MLIFLLCRVYISIRSEEVRIWRDIENWKTLKNNIYLNMVSMHSHRF